MSPKYAAGRRGDAFNLCYQWPTRSVKYARNRVTIHKTMIISSHKTMIEFVTHDNDSLFTQFIDSFIPQDNASYITQDMKVSSHKTMIVSSHKTMIVSSHKTMIVSSHKTMIVVSPAQAQRFLLKRRQLFAEQKWHYKMADRNTSACTFLMRVAIYAKLSYIFFVYTVITLMYVNAFVKIYIVWLCSATNMYSIVPYFAIHSFHCDTALDRAFV